MFGPDEHHDVIVESGMGLGVIGFFVIIGALLVFFVLPVVLFVAELLVAFGAVLLLRGSWIVEATTASAPPENKAWRVRGFGRSKQSSSASPPIYAPAGLWTKRADSLTGSDPVNLYGV